MSTPAGDGGANEGVDYGKSVVFDVVRHPVLKSLDPEDMIKFLAAREEYELEVDEKRKEDHSMSTASFKLCVKPHVLRSIHFMGMSETVAPDVELSKLISEHIKRAIEEVVNIVRKKEPDARAIESALVGPKMPMDIEDSCMRVRQLVVDYLKRVENTGYGSFKDENPKKTVAHLTEALYPSKLKQIVLKDLEYRQSPKKDVRAFIRYVEEQVEHVDRSRYLESGTQNSKKNWKNKSLASSADRAPLASASAPKDKKSRKKEDWKPVCLHPTCAQKKLKHFIKDCKECKDQAERDHLLEERRRKKKAANKIGALHDPEDGLNALIKITFAGKVTRDTCPDSESDVNLMPPDVMAALVAEGADMSVTTFQVPRKYGMAVETFQNDEPVYVKCDRAVTLTTELHIRHGTTLTLRNVTSLMAVQPTTEPLLSRPLLEALGLDARETLAAACDRFKGDVDMNNIMTNTDYKDGSLARLMSSRLFHSTATIEDDAAYESEAENWHDLGQDTEEEIQNAFSDIVQDAAKEGLSKIGCAKMDSLLGEYREIFRLRLGKDPPALVEPMRISLKTSSKPVITRPRRYSTHQRAFIASYVGKLHEYGFIAPNPNASWAAAPLIVPKDPPANFRMTLDYRPVNAATDDRPCPMPHIESALQDVAGSAVFAKINFTSSYWQLPLHADSQDVLSFMTPNGVRKPLRTTQGAKNSARNFQTKVERYFASLSENLNAWLDDNLLDARTENGLLDVMRRFFAICRERRLKLSARMCKLFTKEVRWCGRIISSEEVRVDPTTLAGIKDSSCPETAGELRQYIHCLQWMSIAIPYFFGRVAPLRAVLEEAYAMAGKQTRRSIKSIRLSQLSWGPKCVEAFTELQKHLQQSVRLSHRREGHALCMYTDASENSWAGVVTQCKTAELSKSTEEQRHEPLAFVGASFKGAQLNWNTFEKEAFAIHQTFTKLDYLFICDSTHVFTDHLNVLFVYAPTSLDPSLGRHIVSKVQRWGLFLARFQYTIEHVTGDKNVMADIMTRWYKGYRGKCQAAVKYIREVLAEQDLVSSPVRNNYDWPTASRVRESQRRSKDSMPQEAVLKDGLVKIGEKIWISEKDVQLQLEIIVAAHCGAGGHRGHEATLDSIKAVFVWEGMVSDCQAFVAACIHCITSRAGHKIPRPLVATVHATKPNETTHVDYLYCGIGIDGFKYTLLLRDDLSLYVWLWPCKKADAETAATALSKWISTFGFMRIWVSDQASHFKNKVMEALAQDFGIRHHFVVAYSPWASGTVERCMREVLRTFKALLSEMRLSLTDWPIIVNMVQVIINESPLPRLGRNKEGKYRSPLEVMTGLTPTRFPLRLFPREGYGKPGYNRPGPS